MWNFKEDKGSALFLGTTVPVDLVMKDIYFIIFMSLKTFYLQSFLGCGGLRIK